MQSGIENIVILLGEHGEINERIGHAAHCGHHDAKSLVTVAEQYARCAPKTFGVSQTAAAELMDFPTIIRHLPLSSCAQNGE